MPDSAPLGAIAAHTTLRDLKKKFILSMVSIGTSACMTCFNAGFYIDHMHKQNDPVQHSADSGAGLFLMLMSMTSALALGVSAYYMRKTTLSMKEVQEWIRRNGEEMPMITYSTSEQQASVPEAGNSTQVPLLSPDRMYDMESAESTRCPYNNIR